MEWCDCEFHPDPRSQAGSEVARNPVDRSGAREKREDIARQEGVLATLTDELAKAFAREYARKGQKFDYLYKCKSDSFQAQMRSIASNYEEVEIQSMDVDE